MKMRKMLQYRLADLDSMLVLLFAFLQCARLCVSTTSAMLLILRSKLRNIRFDDDVKDRNIK